MNIFLSRKSIFDFKNASFTEMVTSKRRNGTSSCIVTINLCYVTQSMQAIGGRCYPFKVLFVG